ncbi:MAG: hypothetical protein WAK13_10675, partial [Terriglobales bacterium]
LLRDAARDFSFAAEKKLLEAAKNSEAVADAKRLPFNLCGARPCDGSTHLCWSRAVQFTENLAGRGIHGGNPRDRRLHVWLGRNRRHGRSLRRVGTLAKKKKSAGPAKPDSGAVPRHHVVESPNQGHSCQPGDIWSAALILDAYQEQP